MSVAHYVAELCNDSTPREQKQKALEEIYFLARGKGEEAEEAKEGLVTILFLPTIELEFKLLSLDYLAEVDPGLLPRVKSEIEGIVSFAKGKMELLEESVKKNPRLLSVDRLILSAAKEYFSARTLEGRINELIRKGY